MVIGDLDHKMDKFLSEILLKPLFSDNIFLQARACSILSRLEECEMNNIEMLVQICTKICAVLTSQEIFLRVKGFRAFTLMITMPEIRTQLEADLGQVLKIVFETM